MWKDSHQGVKGQAETFKLDPVCVLNQTGIQVLGWRGRFKGMQRLKSLRCFPPPPARIFLEPLAHLHCVEAGMCPWPWSLGLVSHCSPLLWGCPVRLGIGSSASFSAGPLNKPSCLGYVAGRVLHAEPEVEGCAGKWRLCCREGEVSGICCWEDVGLGRWAMPCPQHLWSHQFVVAAGAWEDVGAEDRSVADWCPLQMAARLKAIF